MEKLKAQIKKLEKDIEAYKENDAKLNNIIQEQQRKLALLIEAHQSTLVVIATK